MTAKQSSVVEPLPTEDLIVETLEELGEPTQPITLDEDRRRARERLRTLQDAVSTEPGPLDAERARLLVEIGELRASGNQDHAGAQAAWEEAARLGSVDALEHLAEAAERDADRAFDALALRRRVIEADPGRVESLRALHRLYADLAATHEAAAIGSVLSIFDTAFPAASARKSDERGAAEGAVERLSPPGLEPLKAVFGMLWEGAYAELRRELAAYGVTIADRVSTLEDSALTRTFLSATRLLGLEKTPLFLRRGGRASVEVAMTWPPAVVVGDEIAADTAVGRFQIGRAVEGARAGLVLAAALAPSERTELYEAARAAFGAGPPSPTSLAARLAKAVPPRTEREIRERCAKGALAGNAESWGRLVAQTMNRAGLLVSGDVPAVLRFVAAEQRDLAGVDLGTESGFREAVGRSPEFADVVSFAVSEAYLTLRWS